MCPTVGRAARLQVEADFGGLSDVYQDISSCDSVVPQTFQSEKKKTERKNQLGEGREGGG